MTYKERVEGVLGDYGVGVAECVLCNHDVYNHYWNGAGSEENSGWDSCKVKDCKCLGKDIEKEPNTVYECPLVTRFVPDKHATTQIINLIESVADKIIGKDEYDGYGTDVQSLWENFALYNKRVIATHRDELRAEQRDIKSKLIGEDK